MTFSINARASSLFITVVVAIPLVIAACSPTHNAPQAIPETPEIVTTPTLADMWFGLLQRTPFPYAMPLPPAQAITLDGTYVKLDPRPGRRPLERRGPPYPPEGGIWLLHLGKGIFRVFHEISGWRTMGSFTVSGNQIKFFNDPHCTQVVGTYTWKLEEGKLVLEVVEDKCFLDLRADSFTSLPWIHHNPHTDVMIAGSSSPTPTAVDTWTRPADGMVMVYVPPGEFEMGSDEDEVDYVLHLCNKYYGDCEWKWFEAEQPVHTVALDGFWIDQTEVTNAQFAQCVAAGACDRLVRSGSFTRDSYYGNSTYDNYPVIYISWSQALEYCTWAGARLPTEAEWEYAARGPEGRRFPWGDEFDGMRLNHCDANCEFGWADETVDDGYADTAPVGSYPAGASWCGALDMAGNVWEWVQDLYGPYPSGRQVNPTGPSSSAWRVLRGGSWPYVPHAVRGAYRNWSRPSDQSNVFGFRCAKSPQ